MYFLIESDPAKTEPGVFGLFLGSVRCEHVRGGYLGALCKCPAFTMAGAL